MNQIIWLLAIAWSVTSSPRFFQVENEFNAKYTNFSGAKLPPIAEERTLQQQLQQYSKMHKEGDFLQFKPDPQISGQLLLKKENGWSQSVYFMGRQVVVTHQQNVHIFDNQSISVYLINCQSREVVFGYRVKHLKAIKTELVTELFELRVVYDGKKSTDGKEEQESTKHVGISMDIAAIGASKNNSTEDDSARTFDKLSKVKTETDRIFVSSLDIWDEVQSHHQEHFQNQEKVYLQAYIELIVVIVLNIIQLLLLKRALKIQSIL